MSTLSPPVLHRLDLACHHISECFGGFSGPFLVGSVQERTAGPSSDVDLRTILDDDTYDALFAGTPEGFATLLDLALGAYVRELTGLPIDFQVQRMTEANERHGGKQRNPLGRRGLTNWIGDARPGAPVSHECRNGPLCDGWPFGVDDAYRTIAAVAWPAEREENRDGWAVTMRNRPDLFEQEAKRARERLEAAIAHGRAAIDRADRVAEPQHEAERRTFTVDEVIEIANETSDSLGNLYRLDFIDRIEHEAATSGKESEASDE